MAEPVTMSAEQIETLSNTSSLFECRTLTFEKSLYERKLRSSKLRHSLAESV